MPETPFDPAPMPVAGAFSEPAAIKAHAEMVNQINVLRSDRDTWRRLCREAQTEVARLEGLILDAEARLAQAMKILRWLRNEAHALLSLEREGIIELVAITNVRALEAKIAEADAALAAAQPEEEK